jgi:hypothetical protein
MEKLAVRNIVELTRLVRLFLKRADCVRVGSFFCRPIILSYIAYV